MEHLRDALEQAKAGDLDGFASLVERFQDMAVGYSYSILGDFHLAEDAAQEAFLEAYPNLHKVYGPEAFPGWFKRIVFKHCDRVLETQDRSRDCRSLATRRFRHQVAGSDGNPEQAAEGRGYSVELEAKICSRSRRIPLSPMTGMQPID